MRLLIILFLVNSVVLFYSCCTCKDASNKNAELQSINESSPTSIAVNLSIISATVKEVVYKSETDYYIKVIVNDVQQTDGYPSIAVAGNEYNLIPNFRYDGTTLIENDTNKQLKTLGKTSAGKEFKAEISLENQNRWFIQRVLSIK